MTNVTAPPLEDNIVDQVLKANASYAAFFENMYLGDVGNAFTPTFVNLSVSGELTTTGRYYRLSDRWYIITATISSTDTTTATAGSTYISNFPLTLLNDGLTFAIVGTGVSASAAQAANNRLYAPGWGASQRVTMVCLVEAR